jgi:hypothetical protein
VQTPSDRKKFYSQSLHSRLLLYSKQAKFPVGKGVHPVSVLFKKNSDLQVRQFSEFNENYSQLADSMSYLSLFLQT